MVTLYSEILLNFSSFNLNTVIVLITYCIYFIHVRYVDTYLLGVEDRIITNTQPETTTTVVVLLFLIC